MKPTTDREAGVMYASNDICPLMLTVGCDNNAMLS